MDGQRSRRSDYPRDAFHVAITNALDFSWEYEERTASEVTEVVLSVLFGPAALFGLALVFLISGVLSTRALGHKPPGRFARDRIWRLGLPLVVYFLTIDPLAEFIGQRAEGEPSARPAGSTSTPSATYRSV